MINMGANPQLDLICPYDYIIIIEYDYACDYNQTWWQLLQYDYDYDDNRKLDPIGHPQLWSNQMDNIQWLSISLSICYDKIQIL